MSDVIPRMSMYANKEDLIRGLYDHIHKVTAEREKLLFHLTDLNSVVRPIFDKLNIALEALKEIEEHAGLNDSLYAEGIASRAIAKIEGAK